MNIRSYRIFVGIWNL